MFLFFISETRIGPFIELNIVGDAKQQLGEGNWKALLWTCSLKGLLNNQVKSNVKQVFLSGVVGRSEDRR